MEQRKAANEEGDSESPAESIKTKKRSRRKDSSEDLSLAQRKTPKACVCAVRCDAN